jgi:hypothetical protein
MTHPINSRTSRFWRSTFALFLGAALAAVACGKAQNRDISGETHFLTACNADTGECGEGLICACGLCSRACADDSECSTLPASQCLTPTAASSPTCESPVPAARCDVACIADEDCQVVSSAHRCSSGFCRAGGAANLPDSCRVDGNEVLVIGDAFMASGHRITAGVEAHARAAGALEPGQRYRDLSSPVANAFALGGAGLSDQYTRAVEEAGVSVVIMNGGGADILVGVCADPPTAACPVVTAAVTAARALFQRMADDGVAHVIYAFYPDPVAEDVRMKMDVLRPLLEAACNESPAPCQFLDLRPVFEGHYAEYIAPDGLNPTAVGALATADAIWATLQAACAAE